MNRRSRQTIRGVTILLALAIALAALPASAQTTTGTLRGMVKDESGAGLPGVTIEAVNDASGTSRVAVTGADGFYNLSLSPGNYTVKAELQSFGADTRKVIVLLGQTQGLDFLLSLRASQELTVTATTPVIESKQSEISTNVTEQQLRALPQDSRNFLTLFVMVMGLVPHSQHARPSPWPFLPLRFFIAFSSRQ